MGQKNRFHGGDGDRAPRVSQTQAELGYLNAPCVRAQLTSSRLSLRINHLEQRDPTVPETEIPTNLAHEDITELLDDTPAENFEPQDERMAHKEASDISERSYLKTAVSSSLSPACFMLISAKLQDTLADDNSPDTQPLNVSSQNLELQGMLAKQQEVRELSTNKRAALERTIANDGLSSPLQRRSTGIDLRGLGSSDKIKCECGWEGEDADQMVTNPPCCALMYCADEDTASVSTVRDLATCVLLRISRPLRPKNAQGSLLLHVSHERGRTKAPKRSTEHGADEVWHSTYQAGRVH